eukprot:203895_1
MASLDIDLEQQLRNEMQNKFNVGRKPNPKKRKLPIHDYQSKKKQKLSVTNTSKSSKQSSIEELKALGLVQNVQGASSAHLIHHHRSSFPAKNDSWKRKKHHRKVRDGQQRRAKNDIEIGKLHHDIHIYPLKAHLWYKLGDILDEDATLCVGHRIDKRELLRLDNSRIFIIAESLYDSLSKRDTIRNEFHSFALSKGTFGDKLSTMMFRVTQFSLSRLRHIESMIDILSRDTKRQSVDVIPSMISLSLSAYFQRGIYWFLMINLHASAR